MLYVTIASEVHREKNGPFLGNKPYVKSDDRSSDFISDYKPAPLPIMMMVVVVVVMVVVVVVMVVILANNIGSAFKTRYITEFWVEHGFRPTSRIQCGCTSLYFCQII